MVGMFPAIDKGVQVGAHQASYSGTACSLPVHRRAGPVLSGVAVDMVDLVCFHVVEMLEDPGSQIYDATRNRAGDEVYG